MLYFLLKYFELKSKQKFEIYGKDSNDCLMIKIVLNRFTDLSSGSLKMGRDPW